MSGNGHEARTSGAADATQSPRAEDRLPDFVVRAWLIVALAAILRFVYIDRFEVWLDEAYCFELASKPVGALLSALRTGNEPPLHLVTLHFWMKLFGESAMAMRSLSALASTATVGLVVFWKTPWLSQRARLLAGLFLAITPISLYYGQQVRMYAILVLVILGSMVFLERGLRLGRKSDWAFFSVLTALGLYTSYVTIYLVPAGYMVIAAMRLSPEWRGRAWSRTRRLFLAQGAAALFFAPWLPVFMEQPSSAAVAWIRPFWERSAKPLMPFRSLSLMTTGGAYYPEYLGYLYQDAERARREATGEGTERNRLLALANRVPAQAALALCVITACTALAASMRSGIPLPWTVLLWSWLVLSFAVPFGLSFAWPVFVPGRYELPGLPAFAILCGIGVARLGPYLRRVLVILAAALFVYTWIYMFSWPTFGRTPFRARVLADTAAPGDVLICESFEYSPMYYALGPKRQALRFLTVPGDMIEHSGWMDFERWFPNRSFDDPPAALAEDAQAVVSRAVAEAPPGGSVILVRMASPTRFSSAIADTVDAAVGEYVARAKLVGQPERSRPDCGILVYQRSM
jgi:4-amino-4-deoxy-L-arabinose transferase-like glycosyltransferase